MGTIVQATELSEVSLKPFFTDGSFGIVLSGGGTRAAYQTGALKALKAKLEAVPNGLSVIVGSSIGAVNTIMLAGCLKDGLDSAIAEMESLWLERTYRNTFAGRPSLAFLRAIKVAILRYSSPGPVATSQSIFNPTPLIRRLDDVLVRHGGLTLGSRATSLAAVGVMTTVEGPTRKPLFIVSAQKKLEPEYVRGATFDLRYVDNLTATHGLASAALPSVLPAVELDVDGGKVRLVDGGICENIPVDPAVRFGADKVVIIDVSGRGWWHDRYGHAHDSRPQWEVPAKAETFCLRPPETLYIRSTSSGLGALLKQAVSSSRRDFIDALGPTWPIYSILKRKMGEDLAFEVMSYIALHPAYVEALIEQGYKDTIALLESAKIR